MADGVNLHGSVSNSTVEQSFLRNLGDDGLASWSDARGVLVSHLIDVKAIKTLFVCRRICHV
jgi:hypothetical protein